jgi:hypothetical protein
MIIVRLAGAALTAALLAGCAASSAPPAPQLPSAAPPTPAAATSSTAPAPQGPPLTIKQAGRLWTRIMGPVNRLMGTFQSDTTTQPPFRQFQAEGTAAIAAVRASEGKLAAVRWPAQVQSDITDLMTSFEPEEIACARAQIQAGSYAVAQNVSTTNINCTEASQDESVDAIEAVLGTPS